jgi:hypothetical protein
MNQGGELNRKAEVGRGRGLAEVKEETSCPS